MDESHAAGMSDRMSEKGSGDPDPKVRVGYMEDIGKVTNSCGFKGEYPLAVCVSDYDNTEASDVDAVIVQFLASKEEHVKIALAGLIAAVAFNQDKGESVLHDDRQWYDAFLKRIVVGLLEMPPQVVEGVSPLGLTRPDVSVIVNVCKSNLSADEREFAIGELIAHCVYLHSLIDEEVAMADLKYDSRTHFCLTNVAKVLDISQSQVYNFEKSISSMIMKSGMNQSHANKELSEEEKREKIRSNRIKNIKVAAAAVGGAVALGVTGGLVLPAIGAGLAAIGGIAATTGGFMASVGGTALFTTLFTAGGMGLTGYKVNRRIRGLRQFQFRRLLHFDEVNGFSNAFPNCLHICICVSGWHINHAMMNLTMKNYIDSSKSGTIDSNLPDCSYEVAEEVSESAKVQDSSGDTYQQPCPQNNNQSPGTKRETENDELVGNCEEWSACVSKLQQFFGEPFQLVWENDVLQEVSAAAEKIAVNTILQGTAIEVLKATTLAALVSAIAWPALVLSAFSYIDNAWAVGTNRARYAGKELARAILSNAHGKRPITLMGHGLGALAIFHCLDYLGSRKKNGSGLILHVFIFGAPICVSEVQWTRARSIVAGNFVNGYSPRDWILAVLFRASTASVSKIAGLSRVQVPGIVDVDVSQIEGVSTQVDYHKCMTAIMEFTIEHLREAPREKSESISSS